MTSDNLKVIIEKYALQFKLPPEIIFGVCKKESTLNPAALRYEPAYRWLYKPKDVKPKLCSTATETNMQMCSWGIMQVMGAVFREYGYTDWLTMIPGDLDTQVKYGSMHLARQLKRFGTMDAALSAYNAGHPKVIQGKFENQSYVDGVIAYSKEYTA